ncbi:hypothetical protein DER46DRAFT_570460 [Fusarium sp. MPI-SDFR-AT-0072]|nr:hypothetical protein DER46DRAFT_570460 [Fusarium sp. MPI-SDFR-AT-0072]
MVHFVAVAGGQGNVGRTIVEVLMVISCLIVICSESSQAEVNLAQACDSSSSTRRFIASQWSIKAPQGQDLSQNAAFMVDIANKAAAIPGSSQDKVAFTYSFDVARFVDALVNTEEKWPKYSIIIGRKITVNEIIAFAKDARGLWITEGHLDLAYEGSLNQIFPHIELTSVKELIGQAWKA